jgi:hypothetical protein
MFMKYGNGTKTGRGSDFSPSDLTLTFSIAHVLNGNQVSKELLDEDR